MRVGVVMVGIIFLVVGGLLFVLGGAGFAIIGGSYDNKTTGGAAVASQSICGIIGILLLVIGFFLLIVGLVASPPEQTYVQPRIIVHHRKPIVNEQSDSIRSESADFSFFGKKKDKPLLKYYCSSCNSSMTFIEDQMQWYCFKCKDFTKPSLEKERIQPSASSPPATSAPTSQPTATQPNTELCPTCSSQLRIRKVSIGFESYNKLYCDNCGKYI